MNGFVTQNDQFTKMIPIPEKQNFIEQKIVDQEVSMILFSTVKSVVLSRTTLT